MKTPLIIGFTALFLAGCQSSTPAPTVTPTETAQPTETVSPLVQAHQNEIASIWESSIHAQAAEPVHCEDCHLVENGLVLEKVSWRNQQTGQHEAVSDADSLCGQCHEGISAGHAHAALICVDCHEPHSTAASCSNSTCHANILQIDDQPPATPIGGHPDEGNPFCGGPSCHPAATQAASKPHSIHGFTHAAVTCVACHDASGLQVGRHQIGGLWVTWRMISEGGSSLTEPYSSHSIQHKVDCKRCHFSNNTWNLPTITGNEFDN